MEMQATDVMSGQMPLREPHSGWGRNISRQHSALGEKSLLPYQGVEHSATGDYLVLRSSRNINVAD